jgi:nitrite reductase/ring-hydroxylating ferredoxin subunit/uncharacterized membrane protein
MFPALQHFIDRQSWLDRVGDPLQAFVVSLFADHGSSGKSVKNVLNGVWLGHPLHPVLTDVPVGAWTMTLLLDSVASFNGDASLEKAADITAGAGLMAAISAAATGWTDWSDTYGRERKVGLAHGLLMVMTTSLYAASVVARAAGQRSKGMALSNAGYAVLSAGAYLGGEEVFDIGYGVNHTAFLQGPTSFTAVMKEADLEVGKPTKADANGTPVVLVKVGEQVYALDDTCVHAGCSLSEGRLDGASIVCACHGSQYDLRDGSVIQGPATMPEPHYQTRVTDGTVEVRLAAN